MTPLRIHRLTLDTSTAVLRVLDDVLSVCRADLVGPRAQLESAEERAMDAEDGRILLWGELEQRPVGLVDARLHHPTPGDVTVSQLAVDRSHRFCGVGRSLVEAVVREAHRKDVRPSGLYAAVLPWAAGAHAFWSSLGYVESADHPDFLWGAVEAP